MFYNAKVEINLTFSNLTSSFILDMGRVMIDATQGISSLGTVSPAISLTNFLLQLISQVSMAMFLMLRQLEHEKTKYVFVVIRGGISYLLCTILAPYIPLKYILCLWFLQYAASLEYLAILFPICIFDNKMQLLCNTYLKVLRREKVPLLVDLVSLGMSAVLCVIGVYVLNSMMAVAICTVIAIIVRSLVTNIYLSKPMSIPAETNVIWEYMLPLILILSNIVPSMAITFCVCLTAFFFYCVFTRKSLEECIDTLEIIK